MQREIFQLTRWSKALERLQVHINSAFALQSFYSFSQSQSIRPQTVDLAVSMISSETEAVPSCGAVEFN